VGGGGERVRLVVVGGVGGGLGGGRGELWWGRGGRGRVRLMACDC